MSLCASRTSCRKFGRPLGASGKSTTRWRRGWSIIAILTTASRGVREVREAGATHSRRGLPVVGNTVRSRHGDPSSQGDAARTALSAAESVRLLAQPQPPISSTSFSRGRRRSLAVAPADPGSAPTTASSVSALHCTMRCSRCRPTSWSKTATTGSSRSTLSTARAWSPWTSAPTTICRTPK